MKELYIYNCKAIFNFKNMVLFLICQVFGGWPLRAILFSERGVNYYQHPAFLIGFYFL